jgi:hypothetical protein
MREGYCGQIDFDKMKQASTRQSTQNLVTEQTTPNMAVQEAQQHPAQYTPGIKS